MSEVKHTPGPWTNHGRIKQPGLPHSSVAAKTLLARVYSEAFGDSEQETANANLIAAAPDLLEALRVLLSLHEPEGRFQPSHFKPILRQAREAIAKATDEPVEQVGKRDYAYREALERIAHGATGYLDNDSKLANIAKRALGMEIDE